MKLLVAFLILLPVTLWAHNSTKEESTISKVLKQLDLKEADVYANLYVETVSPYSDDNTIMIIPIYTGTEIDNEQQDAYILIVDNVSGKILNKYYEPKIQSAELPLLINIEIDTVNYKLNENIQAFGVRLYYTMHSRVNPQITTELSLFIPQDESLQKVLNSYPVYEYIGEVNDLEICLSWFMYFESTVTVDKKKTNGFSDLTIKDIIISEHDCDEETKYQVQRLQYNGNEYIFEEKNIYELAQ